MNMHFKDSSLKNSISCCSVIEKQKTQGQISNVHVIKNANFWLYRVYPARVIWQLFIHQTYVLKITC